MTSACPRFAIRTISVTLALRFCCLYDAFAIAHGTVLSFSPEMMSNGPRSGFLVSTFTSVHRSRTVAHRSEEHTSELQSRGHLVCRLLLEKKKNKQKIQIQREC